MTIPFIFSETLSLKAFFAGLWSLSGCMHFQKQVSRSVCENYASLPGADFSEIFLLKVLSEVSMLSFQGQVLSKMARLKHVSELSMLTC